MKGESLEDVLATMIREMTRQTDGRMAGKVRLLLADYLTEDRDQFTLRVDAFGSLVKQKD